MATNGAWRIFTMAQPILKRGSPREIMADCESLTDEDRICVEGKPNWTPDSPAYVIRIPEFTDLREIGPIPNYFLEVFSAREFLEDSIANLDREPTLQEKCERLIQYALNDA